MIYSIDITKKNISKAINFCLPYEKYSVNLIAFLKQENNFFSNIKDSKLFFLDEQIIGVATLNTHNFFLYCFSFCNEEVLNKVSSLFDFNSIYAIMGEAGFQKQLLNFLSRTLNIRAKIIVPYILMTMLKEANSTNCSALIGNIKIVRANIKDSGILLDLQARYEKEEVCQAKEEFPRCITLMNLEHILKDEIIYFAKIGNLSVAKANTNAIGINYAQIGGVYTLPDYRGRGFASCVVNILMEHIKIKERKNISLFVKEKNIKAIEMYKRLGLQEDGKFYISYFK